MTNSLRPRRADANVFNSAVATLAFFQIGSSMALASQPSSQAVPSEYGFESAVSPDAQRLEREIIVLQDLLRTHNAVAASDTEVIATPVDHSHVSRAVAAASRPPDVRLNARDIAAVMATRTRFPRSLDFDAED